MKRILASLMTVVCVLLAGESVLGGEGALAASGKVMLYSSMQETQLKPIKEGFEARYPGVEMDYYCSDTGNVLKRIAEEHRKGQVGADIIWLGDPLDYTTFKSKGILEKYRSPEAAGIDARFSDPDGYFTGARIVNVGIAYNSDLVTPDEAPKSWKALLDPKWKDGIVITDPALAGTAKYFVTAFLASPSYGPDYFKQLHANGCTIEYGTTATHGQIATGGYKVGIALDYVSRGLRAQGFPVGFVYPAQDLVSIASPIGLVKGCANPENGKLLYDFILSEEGQAILTANHLISVRSLGMEAIARSALPVNLENLAKNVDSTISVFDAIFEN
ncbi:MAG: ABC transporter substrate-binding protein [Synergistaceae bacterium]|nr:ABC transporter substrate-binding protein [Synergistaceae bacterium]